MKANLAKAKSTILIVDDDPTSLNLLREIFDDRYAITVATNAEDALFLVEDGPDLILLDIHLPDKSGFEVCKLIKSNPKLVDIPIIFITASQDSVIEEKGISLGAVDFVSKPYSTPVLRARVHTHLELKHKADQLQALALRDPLTGIANRRYFESMLHAEWHRHARNKSPLSLLMIDIDYFKGINDSYGHQVGDDCIANLASLLTACVRRPADLVARYGGEEFIVMLPETDLEGACIVAEQMRDKAARMHAVQATQPALTISIGCASIMPSMKVSPLDVIKSADDALYYAKSHGRNCVHA